MSGPVVEYRWASILDRPPHSMPAVAELLYLGYEVVRRDGEVCGDARYSAVLCRREVA